MHWIRTSGIIASLIVIVSCFFTWFIWESRGIRVSGMHAEIIRWGRPAYGHFFFCGLFLVLHLGKSISLRIIAVVMAALNLAWAVRDIYIGLGNNGEEIVMQPALYILIVSAVLMLFAVLFAPDKTQINQAPSDSSQ